MQQNIQAHNLAGSPSNVSLLTTQDKCPRCHKYMIPRFMTAGIFLEQGRCQAVFRCLPPDVNESHHKPCPIFLIPGSGNCYIKPYSGLFAPSLIPQRE